MNILVHDDPPAVGRLVRAALAGRSHRASIAQSADEARRKLETGLFDALFIGAGGASREIAEFLESEWPDLPIVLAGVERDVPCVGPIVAVVTRPIRLDSLKAAVKALEARAPSKTPSIEAVLVAAGIDIPGRVVARGRGNLLFEPSTASRFEGDRVTVRCAGADLDADLVFSDPRFLAVHVDDAAALDRCLSGGVAC